MNRILFSFIIVMTIMTTLHATNIITDKTKLQALQTKNKVLKAPSLEIIAAIEKADFHLLKVEAKSPSGIQLLTMFLDKKSANLYIGSGYDKEGHLLTFPKDVKTIKDGVAFSYGKGSTEIYLVTDPECPYCTRFEKAAQGKLDRYRVHVILMPLSFHKKAPAMIEWIMQGKDDATKKQRFEEIMLKGSTKYQALQQDTKKPFVYSPAVAKSMKRMNKAIMELKVKGTPALFNANFEPLSQGQVLNSGMKGKKK